MNPHLRSHAGCSATIEPKRSATCSFDSDFSIYAPRLFPRGMRFHAERCLRLAANRSVSHSFKRRNYSHKSVEPADANPVDYSATLLLPKHDVPFPSRWNVLPTNVKNSTVLQKCVDVYKWQVLLVPVLNLTAQSDNLTGEPFILHDGPPYANGDLHLGLLPQTGV
jgi:hypothetical protein